jgi:hypothetical protein
MISSFIPEGEGVRVDLTHWRWVIGVYLDDLLQVLGPLPDVPDHPLDALAAAIEDAPEPPSDPIRARLLPDGVLDDPDAAAEFRRFTQTTLLARKHTDAAALRAAARAPTVVDAAGARSLLGAFNDLRLMLGTRLGVTDEGVPGSDDDIQAYRSYQLFTFLQGELVDALAGEWGGQADPDPAP